MRTPTGRVRECGVGTVWSGAAPLIGAAPPLETDLDTRRHTHTQNTHFDEVCGADNKVPKGRELLWHDHLVKFAKMPK